MNYSYRYAMMLNCIMRWTNDNIRHNFLVREQIEQLSHGRDSRHMRGVHEQRICTESAVISIHNQLALFCPNKINQ